MLTAAVRSVGTEARPGRILLLAALPWEVRPFLRRSQARPRAGLGFPAWEFALGEAKGLAALSGMGAGAGRRAAEAVIAAWRPEVLVSLGFAGALTPEVPPGALVLGEAFWRYDPETTALEPAAAPAPPRPLPELLARLQEAGLPVLAGAVVTTPHILDKDRQGGPLKGLGHPVLDLETGVLAEVAAAAGLFFLSLRAVTDGAGEEIPGFLRISEGVSPGPGTALRWLAGNPGRLAPLLKLWRRSRRAGRLLAAALLALLPLLSACGRELHGQPAKKGHIDEDSHPA